MCNYILLARESFDSVSMLAVSSNPLCNEENPPSPISTFPAKQIGGNILFISISSNNASTWAREWKSRSSLHNHRRASSSTSQKLRKIVQKNGKNKQVFLRVRRKPLVFSRPGGKKKETHLRHREIRVQPSFEWLIRAPQQQMVPSQCLQRKRDMCELAYWKYYEESFLPILQARSRTATLGALGLEAIPLQIDATPTSPMLLLPYTTGNKKKLVFYCVERSAFLH